MRREPDFDESADMRLVELQRAALGIEARPRTWESRVQTEGSTVEAERIETSNSAIVAVDISATPIAGVIPGAVVTCALSLANVGVLPARDVVVAVPLPGDALYRSGSLVQDGREQSDGTAELLFGDGLRILELAPSARATLVWKISVRVGAQPLVVTPIVRAEDAAVVGGRSVVVTRRALSETAFSGELRRADVPEVLAPLTAPQRSEPDDDLPFYELDEEEHIEYVAGDAAMADLAAPESPTVPPLELDPVAALEPESVEAREPAIVLIGTLDRPSLAYFTRTFNGAKPPTLLSHFLFSGALACGGSVSGDDPGLNAYVDAQSQILHRIVLHERLGRKEPITEYAGPPLDASLFGGALVPTNSSLVKHSDAQHLLLVKQLEEDDVAQLRRFAESPKWDFVAARQATLLVQGTRLGGVPSDAVFAKADAALNEYARTLRDHLARLFVRIRLDRTTGALYQRDETLDESAQRTIAALEAAFSALT